jgi:hypothetical protein
VQIDKSNFTLVLQFIELVDKEGVDFIIKGNKKGKVRKMRLLSTVKSGNNTHTGKSKKKVLLIVAIVLAALLLIYLLLALFFQTHFCFRTTVNHVKVSADSVSNVEKKIGTELKSYELTLNERDKKTEKISGADIGIKPEFNGEIEKMLKKQNAFAWPYYLFAGHNLTADAMITFDKDDLTNVLKKLDCMNESNWKKSANAHISDYSADGYKIVDEVYGTTVDVDAFEKTVANAVSSLKESVDLSSEKCYQDPTITSKNDKIVKAVALMNQYAGMTITYDVGDTKEKLDGNEIHNWLKVGDDCDVTVDNNTVSEYVKGLSKKYNTAYRNRTLNTSYGQTVTIVGGDYGWKIDNAGETDMILKDLKAGQNVERELTYSQTANSHGDHDYGNTYVEINLTAQHLFFYKNGSLVVQTDLVSGNLSKNAGTPVGAYDVTYKQKDATLRGPDYESKVSFWMPFNNDVGMHDAPWRSSFGGSIYKRSGSHGCVNLPPSIAKTIFENIDAGYPVLVYELPGTESPLGIAQDTASATDSTINAIGAVTLNSQGAIQAARASYDALTDQAKAYVTKLDILTAAEASLAQLQSDAADQAAATQAQNAAQPVIDKIKALGTITPDSKGAIKDARKAYDALPDMAKAYVSNYASLVDAENALHNLGQS